uniref:N-acetylglucosaminylphosphatidylinositol deacetylase n=1 Tax=Caenorhabditis japonica TaxID=281687 RepID=A0A8R1HZM9_CAEJA
GKIRARELSVAASKLGISASDVTCLDYDDFEDGDQWNRNALCHIIMRHVEVLAADAVISFDAHGVSGHHNHASCFEALQTAYSNGGVPRDVQIFVLDSIPLWRKYIGLADALFSFGRSPFFYVARFRDVAACWKAMWAHRSQFVWFRVLFIFFSR